MAKGLRITNPGLVARERNMRATDIGVVARKAAADTATILVRPMRDALQSAAGDRGIGVAVTVMKGHQNELVMRQRGHSGDVLVGVDGHDPAADLAEELEWGGIDSAPAAWVRTTALAHAREVTTRLSRQLTVELDRAAVRGKR